MHIALTDLLIYLSSPATQAYQPPGMGPDMMGDVMGYGIHRTMHGGMSRERCIPICSACSTSAMNKKENARHPPQYTRQQWELRDKIFDYSKQLQKYYCEERLHASKTGNLYKKSLT